MSEKPPALAGGVVTEAFEAVTSHVGRLVNYPHLNMIGTMALGEDGVERLVFYTARFAVPTTMPDPDEGGYWELEDRRMGNAVLDNKVVYRRGD